MRLPPFSIERVRQYFQSVPAFAVSRQTQLAVVNAIAALKADEVQEAKLAAFLDGIPDTAPETFDLGRMLDDIAMTPFRAPKGMAS